MELFDTHCHIHEILGDDDVAAKWHKAGISKVEPVLEAAAEANVNRLMVVGCSAADSALAVDFVRSWDNCWASIGIHPHEAESHVRDQTALERFAQLAGDAKVKAIGECGLDYFYTHSSKAKQQTALRFQIELALQHDLPMIFHVREAFDDFWPVFDGYEGIRGVVHSFSSDEADLEQVLKRNLYVGLNGIMTFTKDQRQLTAARSIPLSKLLVETDAPYLTPKPFRGIVNEPKFVGTTAAFLAELRGEPIETLAAVTTQNARDLFAV